VCDKTSDRRMPITSGDLFGSDAPANDPGAETKPRGDRPLADRLRPRILDEVVGQDHLVGPDGALTRMLARGSLASLILWGPPGVGKTTIARLLAARAGLHFVQLSAVFSGVADLKKAFDEAARRRRLGEGTLLFVDEIHRFNRAQQDGFLPVVEEGTVTLIGATTENPSFEINGALLSRCRVYVLKPLTEDQIVELLGRALTDTERGLGSLHLVASREALRKIAAYSSGDARNAYNVLEVAAALSEEQKSEPQKSGGQELKDIPSADGSLARPATAPTRITEATIQEALQKRVLLYDKSGEEHYNIISALHKSVRNSDPDAALYWLARMLEAGEDPLYIARRLVRMAVEDIGLAEPNALALSMAARDAVDFLGMPEGNLALAEAVVYLSVAPKSNALYTAYSAVQRDVEETAAEPVPLHLRNAPTSLMKGLGYGKNYQYAHDTEAKVADMQCLPESLGDRVYYRPTSEGAEKRIRERLEEIKRLKQPAANRTSDPPSKRTTASTEKESES